MIDALEPAAALAPAAAPIALADEAAPAGSDRWRGLGEDVRFFLVCYLAGLLVFLVMLS